MNWVLIVGGLIPFWTALLIIFMNRGASKHRRPLKEVPDYETDYASDYDEPPQPRSRFGFPGKLNLGFLSGLRGRLPGKSRREAPEPQMAPRGDAEDMYDEVEEFDP